MTQASEKEALKDRRPLASRNTSWARSMARWLAGGSITPNQISLASVVAAAIALLAFFLSSGLTGWPRAVCFIVAAFACQLRLLCNLMDGMVAIEAGKQTPDGPVWNELPDRVADALILSGLGLAAHAAALGWAVATLAVATAYVRELGKGIDGTVDFRGPMAKPQRMALVTLASLLAAVVSVFSADAAAGPVETDLTILILKWSLVLCAAGCLLTFYRRSQSLLTRLKQSGS